MTSQPTTWWEAAARAFEPPTSHQWDTPGQLAHTLDPRITQTPALTLIDNELTRLWDTPDDRLILSMPPQEGKSQRASRAFPLWALTRNPDTRIAIASYEANVARRWGRAIRDDITNHHTTLHLAIRDDVSAQHEWQLDGHDGGVFTSGVGGPLTGRPVDLMIIDDPVKDRIQADSQIYRDRVWDWWTDTVATRLAPGAPVVLILTRWHHDDLAGRLINSNTGWRVLNIPAQCDNPDTDPLGRRLDEFMISARGRTQSQWEARKRAAGPHTWASLYQGHPTPRTSGVLPADWPRDLHPIWIERDDGTRWVPGADEVIQSWDLTFKDAATSDFVVGQVWVRIGTRIHLLDQTRGRYSFTATLQAIRDMTARWPQAVAKLVEDKANGPAVINSLTAEIPGIIPVEPTGSKYARAVAASPFCAAGNVHLPDSSWAPWVVALTDEIGSFPAGTHDDQVDALTQAVNQLLLHPILTSDGSLITSDDILDGAFDYLGGY